MNVSECVRSNVCQAIWWSLPFASLADKYSLAAMIWHCEILWWCFYFHVQNVWLCGPSTCLCKTMWSKSIKKVIRNNLNIEEYWILIISPTVLHRFWKEFCIFCNEGKNLMWHLQPSKHSRSVWHFQSLIVSHPQRRKWSMWLLLAASGDVKSRSKAEILLYSCKELLYCDVVTCVNIFLLWELGISDQFFFFPIIQL